MKTSIIFIRLIFSLIFLLIFSGNSFSYIEGLSPLLNSQDLDTKGNIYVKFRYPMIASTINSSTIIVDGNQSGKILFSIVYDEQSRVVKIDPVRDLKAGEKIRVKLTSEILTIDQGHIPPYMYSFKIKPTGGSGIFPETVTSYLGEDPISAMLTGDFDRDGDLDLCVIRTENSLKKL